MTLLTSSEAEKAVSQDKLKIKEVKNQLDFATQSLDGLTTVYGLNQMRVNTLKNNNKGVDTGPWKNLSNNIQAIETPGIIKPRAGQDHVFNYILEPPMSLVYNNPDPLLKSTLTTTIPDMKPKDYSDIFSEANIKGIADMKVALNQALSNLDGFNVSKFQASLTTIKKTLTDELFADAKVLRDIIKITNTEINNPQSLIYKGESAYGPYSTNQIALFRLPPELLEIQTSCSGILDEIRNLFTIIDKLLNMPEDVIARAALLNAGLIQSSTDPNVFNAPVVEEKDPWGIKFSYIKTVSGQDFAQEAVKDPTRSNNTLVPRPNITGPDDPSTFVDRSPGLLNSIVNTQKDFYFQLLPAIKSNLPVSGATDVPGAMPGIQFRIENNIVKHKIPGFAPVYQPMGIDSIKCTLVGMFTGNDGVDISAAYSTDINTGLLAPKNSLFSTKTNTNPSPSSTQLPASQNVDSSGLPIPASNKSNTASDIAVLSEDAFRGAQDFYNEIVVSGREVDVELNLRKGSGPNTSLDYSGGTPGPFRDEVTGNPKFKALIKRLDLYYTRRDRCWFILDLEVTDAGLIGKECINLTNIIEEATELFEAIEEAPIGLTKEELDDCFKNPVTYKYKGEKSNIGLRVDLETGLSYEFNLDSNTLLNGEIYPTSTRDTLNKIGKQWKNFKGEGSTNRNGSALLQIINILNKATDIVQKNPGNKDKCWAFNKVKINTASVSGNSSVLVGNVFALKDRYALYDKNSGEFYAVNAKKELRDVKTEVFSFRDQRLGTLNDIVDDIDVDFLTFDGKTQESIDFFIDEYLPLVTLKPNSCDRALKDKQKAAQQKKGQENKGNELETSLNLGLPTNPTPLTQTDFFKPAEVNKDENKNVLDNQLVKLKENVENGTLDKFLQEGLTDYVKILTTDNATTNILSPELIKTLKKARSDSSLKLVNPNNGPIFITMKSTSATLDGTQSNEQELFIEVSYDISDSIVVEGINGNKSKTMTSIYKSRIDKKAKIIVKAYTTTEGKDVVYKIDAIDIIS